MKKQTLDRWKTGQRVPVTDHYVDQYGYVSFHEAHRTFPPCIDRKGECAIRTRLRDWDGRTRHYRAS